MAAPVPAAAPSAPAAPPSAGPSADEQTVRSTLDIARKLALLIALAAGILFLVLLVFAVVRAILGAWFGGFFGVAYCLVSFFVNYLLWKELPAVGSLVDQHQYRVARDRLLVWVILGLLFFVADGVVLLIAWLKLDSMAHLPTVELPPGPTPPACPRCGGPLAWIGEYQRNYCYRCSAYA